MKGAFSVGTAMIVLNRPASAAGRWRMRLGTIFLMETSSAAAERREIVISWMIKVRGGRG